MCSNRTRHVLQLHLMGSYHRGTYLRGNLSPSILQLSQLHYLDLSGNDFKGQQIPEFIGSLKNLRHLDVSYSLFHGRIPYQFRNLTRLQFLDLSSLRSMLYADNLDWLSGLSSLNFVALSRVNLSRAIDWLHVIGGLPSPSTLNIDDGPETDSCGVDVYTDTETLNWKGMESEYKQILGYLTIIDLSSNKLVGEIPVEVTSLEGLRSLNLSRNSLSGSIPLSIDRLTSLDSLDLSNNRLVGEIPDKLSSLGFLGVLNLSHNNLSGKIPMGAKPFDASSFIGNPYLCGFPLSNKCSQTQFPVNVPHEENADEDDDDAVLTLGFFACMATGFILGFWGVVGSLILKTSWRLAYFRFLSNTEDRLYVMLTLVITRLQR